MQIKKEEIKKILLIKPRGIGDIIHSTIVLESLSNYLPSANIHYLTEEFAKRAVENNPFVSKVITFDKNDFLLKIVSKIRKEKYDFVFDFWSNPKTAQVTFLSGAKYRAGYDKRGRRYAYNIKTISNEPDLHAAENHLILLKYLQIPIIIKKTLFYLSEEEKSFAKNFVSKNFSNENIIGIIPSGGWESKRCEPEKWIEICNAIYEKYKVIFIILWGPGDEKDATEIKNSLGENGVMIPHTTVGELAGLINECKLVIANDSGPMHIAAALEIPIIGLFGPTNPKAHRPYSINSDYVIKGDLHCIICNKLTCPYNHECMKELPVDDVLLKFDLLMEKAK
jgi:lipopolysaccharide heptosyltransferase II